MTPPNDFSATTPANSSAGAPSKIERRLRLSGILLIIGLLIEVACLFRARPLSFLAFITFGGAFLVLGLATYLLSLLPAGDSANPHTRP